MENAPVFRVFSDNIAKIKNAKIIAVIMEFAKTKLGNANAI